MRKFIYKVSDDGVITVYRHKFKLFNPLGTIELTNVTASEDKFKLVHRFLSSMGYIPKNWTDINGDVLPTLNMYGVKYSIDEYEKFRAENKKNKIKLESEK